MKKNLNGIKRVRFCDYTSYEAEKSSNGGCYGFWKDYNRLDDDMNDFSGDELFEIGE